MAFVNKMLRLEHQCVLMVAVTLGNLCGLMPGTLSLAATNEPSDWKEPFRPDKHTVVLYHFDEGRGNETRDACGDPALTLHAHKEAIWGRREGFASTSSFTRRGDDANVLVGPANNDKLHLATCTEAWTIEAWVKYTGPYGRDWTNTVASIAGTDDEGVNLQHGYRGGWHFILHNVRKFKEDGLSVYARFMGHLPAPDERGRWAKDSDFGLPFHVDGYTSLKELFCQEPPGGIFGIRSAPGLKKVVFRALIWKKFKKYFLS